MNHASIRVIFLPLLNQEAGLFSLEGIFLIIVRGNYKNTSALFFKDLFPIAWGGIKDKMPPEGVGIEYNVWMIYASETGLHHFYG